MSDVTITTYEGTEVDAEHFGYTITVTQGASSSGGVALESYVDQIETLDDYPATFPPAAHTHDDRYYTEAEVDTALAAKASTAALAAHEADTTNVHGIADTANLVLEGDSRLTNSRAPSGAAGGVLSGTYPNPGFAADMATQAEVDAEAALARNADNLTSGTVADARIASTIARDSEVTAAISTSEAGQVRDGDAAGGVLAGTYPNPSFAADMATQAELDAHVNDTTDAHDASAISFSPTGTIAATDVQAAIAELDTEKATTGSVTTVAGDLAAHLADTSDAHDASAISFSPTGTIAATDVQAAIAEVAAEAGGGGATDLEGLSDVDLTSPADDDFLQRKSGQFVNRTVAQVKTDLALAAIATSGSASDLASGTVAPARLGTGSGGSSKFLREDSTWQTVSGGGGGSVATDAIFDAKGDLAVGTGSDTAARLAVGANGLLLSPDSAQSTGLKWVAPAPLAYVAYNPGTLQTITTTSTSATDVDATNLAVTFTAPASGAVLVALMGFSKNGATDKANLWYLRNGSTTVASRYAVNNFYPIGVTAWMKVASLTPGDSYTLKWAHSTESGSTAYLQYGGAVGPAVMVVWGG